MDAKPRIRKHAVLGSTDGAALRPGAMVETAHSGASWYSRDVATWMPSRGSADSDLLPELDTLVSRARDIDRNNGVAKSGIQTGLDNVLGTGLRLVPKPDYKTLGWELPRAAEWSRIVRSKWEEYWWTTKCDAADMMTGDQIAQLQLRTQYTAGESVTLPLWIDRRDGFKTKLQTIEPDRMRQPWGRPDSDTLRGGVQREANTGAPNGYWFTQRHPGDVWAGFAGVSADDFEFVPRYTDFGRLRVLHVFDADRSGQSRGKPILSSVLPLFKQLDRYTRAEVDAAVANAMVAGVITTPLDQDGIVELFRDDQDGYMKARAQNRAKLESGTILPLFPGDKFEGFLPQRPASGFGAFMENILRFVAVALDMPYELLLKDFSKSTYSSARAAMLEAWRAFNRRRDHFSTQWCDPIFGLWLEEQVNANVIEAPDFYAKRFAYQRCRWIGPGRGFIDVTKEAQGAGLRVQFNISTLEDENAEQGRYWEETLEQRALETARIKELGLTAPDASVVIANHSPGGPPDQGQQQQDGTNNDAPQQAAAGGN